MVRCALATSGDPAGYGGRAKLRWPAAVPGMRAHTVRRAAPVTVFLPGEENLGRYNHEQLATQPTCRMDGERRTVACSCPCVLVRSLDGREDSIAIDRPRTHRDIW